MKFFVLHADTRSAFYSIYSACAIIIHTYLPAKIRDLAPVAPMIDLTVPALVVVLVVAIDCSLTKEETSGWLIRSRSIMVILLKHQPYISYVYAATNRKFLLGSWECKKKSTVVCPGVYGWHCDAFLDVLPTLVTLGMSRVLTFAYSSHPGNVYGMDVSTSYRCSSYRCCQCD